MPWPMGGCHLVWFDRRLTYEQFGLDARGFRRAVRQYDEGRDDLLSSLYYGLVLGSLVVVEELRKRLEGRRDREKPQLQALRSHGSIEDRLAEYGRRLGLGTPGNVADLRRPTRHVESGPSGTC